MTDFEILESIKRMLRIEENELIFDDELIELIKEAKEDLGTSGVGAEHKELFIGAVKTYVRAHFEIDSDTSDKILKVYESKKQKLSILGGE